MNTWNQLTRKRPVFHSRLLRRIRRRLFDDPRAAGYLNQKRHLAEYDIGRWTHGQLKVERGLTGNLTIGKFCSIGKGTIILLGGEHRTDWITTYAFSGKLDRYRPDSTKVRDLIRSKGDVVIGNDVWIGEDCYIMSGVTVGNGAVIGARSVVRRDIPSYSIVAGNPARVAGYRFDKNTIAKLEAIAWWDWPLEKIIEAIPLLLSDAIEDFISRHYSDSSAGNEKDGAIAADG